MHMENFHIPNLAKLGLANLHPMQHVASVQEPMGYYTKMIERSVGKDTMTGHWEMMGLYICLLYTSEHNQKIVFLSLFLERISS